MRALAQVSDLVRLSFRVFKLPTVTQDASNQPESSDANRRSAMYERRPVRRIVGDLQKLRHLFFFWIAVDDRNVEVAQAEFFRLCFFLLGAVFGGLAQINDRFHAF